jgi:hypothetical protein
MPEMTGMIRANQWRTLPRYRFHRSAEQHPVALDRVQLENYTLCWLAEADYRHVKDKLDGLQASVKLYLKEVSISKDRPSQIGNTFDNLQMKFVSEIPAFKDARYQLLLLPLFVQVITM